jgi:hypothetical protein
MKRTFFICKKKVILKYYKFRPYVQKYSLYVMEHIYQFFRQYFQSFTSVFEATPEEWRAVEQGVVAYCPPLRLLDSVPSGGTASSRTFLNRTLNVSVHLSIMVLRVLLGSGFEEEHLLLIPVPFLV